MSVFGLVFGSTADEDNALIKDLLEADRAIDKSVTPWQLVLIRRGTGPLGTGQELMRQDIFDLDGNPVQSADTVPGRWETPSQ